MWVKNQRKGLSDLPHWGTKSRLKKPKPACGIDIRIVDDANDDDDDGGVHYIIGKRVERENGGGVG